MKIAIDENSGFCFGVVSAVNIAEQELAKEGQLLCLGKIVHNKVETKRLVDKGLKVIDNEEFAKIKNQKVLIRAHGEAPQTYQLAKQNGIEIVDATCPIVLNLQKKIKESYEDMKQKGGKVYIFGKQGHAEVLGLEGQTNFEAIVISDENDISLIDFTKAIRLFSQTTKSKEGFQILVKNIQDKMPENADFVAYQSICKIVENRSSNIKDFCKKHDVIIFVSDIDSSNGKELFESAKSVNPNSHFVSTGDEIKKEWFTGIEKIGICGATSTPFWFLEEVRVKILEKI